MKKIKISELPSSTEMEGLYTIGTDANNQSVKVPMGFLKETTEYVTEKTAEAVATANQAKSAIDNLKASDVPYDLTQTPDLGSGDVQSAIEALNSQKVEYIPIEGNNIQLKNGNGNLLMPKTMAELVTLEGNNLTDLQAFLDDEINVPHTATFPELSTTPINAWSRKNVAAGNKYIVNGYITKIVIYGGANGNIDYGVIDLSTTPYTLTKYGNTTITTGKNVIIPKTPIPVDSTHIFGFSQVANCMSFQSTGIGSYYDSTFHSTVNWQYYFEYKAKEDLYALENIACNTIKLTGGEGEERVPYFVGFNENNQKRWSVRFNNNEAGDVLEVNCNTGWGVVAFVPKNSDNTIAAYAAGLNNYVSGEHKVTIPFKYLDGYDFRLLFKKNNETAITYADWSANCSFKLYKPYTDITNVPQKEISILFIGNSLTQDSISYLPWLMCLLCPEVKFRFYVWYVGGKTLAQHLEYFQNDTPCEIFSVSEKSMRWTNFANSKTMSAILSDYKFDIVCLQEYFNYKSEFTDADKQTYQSVIDYITTNYGNKGALKFISLFHQPKRSGATDIFNLTMQAQKWYLANTITESMLSPGIAIYRALSTDLDSLGDQGHLSPDGTHAQEGLPCVMQAYTVLMWIYKHLGIPKSVYNFRQTILGSIYGQNSYTYINVPGPNLGNGVISGTVDQNLLAQQVAIKAFREGECIVNNAYDNE